MDHILYNVRQGDKVNKLHAGTATRQLSVVEPPAHILEHFITGFWRQVQEQDTRRHGQRNGNGGRQGTQATLCTAKCISDDIPTTYL